MIPFPRLFPRLQPVPKSQQQVTTHNGNGMSRLNTKSSLLPRGAYSPEVYEFFSPDGGNTIIPIHELSTSLAFVAYWYVATRWRAQKIAEAPLMIVSEDQEDGSEDWIPDHELVPILDEPSPDYDMGELLERTSRYLDNGAECLWAIDKDRINRVGRITPFRRGEYKVERVGDRLYGKFSVNTDQGPREYTPDEVCYFRETTDDRWTEPRSRLDVAMAWLRLGEKSRATIRDLLDNSVWPSGVIIPDKDWNPDPETYEQYKQDLQQYGEYGEKGRPFVALGGGSFTTLTAKIRDLVPEEVLNRVESVVAAVSGVPAIVLQFQVGMENSPWSQMEQARKMGYDDCIQPAWRKIERVLTRQLLRPVDDNPTHFVRFDRSNIAALQQDRQIAANITLMISRIASVNERRVIVGLEPITDPTADDIPELTSPLPSPFGGFPSASDDADAESEDDDTTDEDDPETDDDEDPDDTASAKQQRTVTTKAFLARKVRSTAVIDAWRDEARPMWKHTAQRLLNIDAENIAELARVYLTEPEKIKSVNIKRRAKDRVMSAIIGYLKGDSQKAWARATTPMLVQASERSVAFVAADIGIRYDLVQPVVIRFAQAESAFMVEGISKTTRDHVATVIAAGIEEERTTAEIARVLEESTSFSKERAELIARTEITRAFNGAPQKAMTEYSRAAKIRIVKTWSTAGDANVRDEHAAMDGETVEVDAAFSNGLQYPAEPNCRCVALYSEVND